MAAQNIARTVNELETAGVVVRVPDRWWSPAWPPAPTAAELKAGETTGGQFQFGRSTYSAADANDQLILLRQRLQPLGIKHFLVDVTSPHGGRQQIIFDLEASEEQNRQHRLSASTAKTQAEMDQFFEELRAQNATPANS
jgi:hypothetical protein